MPGYNNNKISHSRCPISLQHVIGQALSQYHKGHALRLSHGYQIPNCKWSRNGSRKTTRSQGVLLSIIETKKVDNISEELEPIQLDDQPEHLVYIGSKLAKDVRSLLIHFLKQNMKVFSWK